jgi:hypothetical protein
MARPLALHSATPRHSPPVPQRRPRIGLIGGLHRSEGQFVRAAAAAGYELEFHAGDMVGRRAQGLESMIPRVDLLFIVTDVNSHNAVMVARRLASEYGIRYVLLRRCNPTRLIELVRAMTTTPAARAA